MLPPAMLVAPASSRRSHASSGNAIANFILSRMNEGSPYQDALAEAQAAGLAERDPVADVEGDDTVAKVMILSALVFGTRAICVRSRARAFASSGPAVAPMASRGGSL